MAIHVTTSNIRGFPVQPSFDVVKRIAQAARFPGINFGQEIYPYASGYQIFWHETMRAHGKTTYCSTEEVPVSIPHQWWDVTYSAVHKLTDAGPAHSYQPARYLSIVQAKSVLGVPVAFVNLHPEQSPRKSTEHYMAWFDYAYRAAEIVEQIKDHHVIFGGDLNWADDWKEKMPIYPHLGELLYSNRFDHLFARPMAGYRAHVVSTEYLPPNLHMDHPILSVAVDFVKK